MKIVCLIRSLTLGGAERQMMGLAKVLSAAGIEVVLLVYHKNSYYQAECEDCGVKTEFLDKGLTSLGFSIKLASYVRKNGVDVVISFLPGPNKKACVAKLFHHHFRLIVSERNFNVCYLPHDFLRFSLYGLADKVVCNNHSQEAFIRERCPWLRSKLSTIVNFAPLEKFRPALAPPCNPVRKIVVAARLCPRKNPYGLVLAAAMLKKEGYDFKIEWYGAEENCFKRKVGKAIIRHGVADCFLLMPASHEMVKVYHSADVFCLPSLYEGTSNAIAEALCCGLPVVASAVSDTPLYVKEGENGFLCRPGDVQSLSDALRKALLLPDEQFAAFGTKSRTVVEGSLGIDSFSESWLNLL